MKRTQLKRGTSQLKRSGFKRTVSGSKRPLGASKVLKGSKSRSKTKTQAQLKKELDSVFSKFIRQKYADKHTGLVKCYTCQTVKHWKEMQNGHWIPRNILITRFSEENCRVQCTGCNMFQKGRPDVFAVNLLKEGIDIVALEKTKNSMLKIDRAWYVDKIKHYQSLLVE